MTSRQKRSRRAATPACGQDRPSVRRLGGGLPLRFLRFAHPVRLHPLSERRLLRFRPGAQIDSTVSNLSLATRVLSLDSTPGCGPPAWNETYPCSMTTGLPPLPAVACRPPREERKMRKSFRARCGDERGMVLGFRRNGLHGVHGRVDARDRCRDVDDRPITSPELRRRRRARGGSCPGIQQLQRSVERWTRRAERRSDCECESSYAYQRIGDAG